MAGVAAQRGYEAEDLVAELFEALGYTVQREIRVAGVSVDMVISKNALRTPVEVKSYQNMSLGDLRNSSAKLLSLENIEQKLEKPIIVVTGKVTKSAKEWAQSQFDLTVWDEDTLLTKAQPYNEIARRISLFVGREALPEVTIEIELSDEKESDKLIRKIQNHIERNSITPSQYEKLCLEIMLFLFSPHLFGFEAQAKTTDGGNRYDFVCRIRGGDPFWDSIQHDFRTRSIIFECKNYNKRITADQVYSTERYLFSGALRTVCFLISRKGPDKGCIRSAQGALRESGKLIILLSNQDLVQMLQLRKENNKPEEYLEEKIWKFIITLPR
jgi:Holliday junction resolvase-like predicted endonuclease